jgi:hypothetical protein
MGMDFERWLVIVVALLPRSHLVIDTALYIGL